MFNTYLSTANKTFWQKFNTNLKIDLPHLLFVLSWSSSKPSRRLLFFFALFCLNFHPSVIPSQGTRVVFRRGRIRDVLRRRNLPANQGKLLAGVLRRIRKIPNHGALRWWSTYLGCMYHAGVFCRVICRRFTPRLNAPYRKIQMLMPSVHRKTSRHKISSLFKKFI